jgi:hypothetical protein
MRKEARRVAARKNAASGERDWNRQDGDLRFGMDRRSEIKPG